MLSLLLTPAALAACPDPTTSGDLAALLDRAEDAYASLDEPAFRGYAGLLMVFHLCVLCWDCFDARAARSSRRGVSDAKGSIVPQ
jgi:hypothetical protein